MPVRHSLLANRSLGEGWGGGRIQPTTYQSFAKWHAMRRSKATGAWCPLETLFWEDAKNYRLRLSRGPFLFLSRN